MKAATLLLFMASIAAAAERIDVKVVAVHAVTHEDNGSRAMMDKAILGSHAPNRQKESYNLDAIVGTDHVVLACDDPAGCESPALGTYSGEVRRSKWIKLTFPVPLAKKPVSRWYRVAGSWGK